MYLIFQLAIFIILLALAVIAYAMIRPFFKMRRLKTKLGNRINCIYHPIVGYLKEITTNLEKYGDSYKNVKLLT
jgi:hypothetical protein